MNTPYAYQQETTFTKPKSEALQFLLSGLDTVECAYFLVSGPNCSLDFERLTVEK